MILIVGGLGAGKRAFAARTLGFGPEEMSADPECACPVLHDLQDIDPLPGLEELLLRRVVICSEVGCGVVPMDPLERTRREAVGRLCCRLAERAEAVYRVSCGLPMRLK